MSHNGACADLTFPGAMSDNKGDRRSSPEDRLNLFAAMDLSACALSAYVGISNLSYYLRERSVRARLHFSLLCFSVALYDAMAAMVYSTASPWPLPPWQRLEFFASVAIAIEVVHFTYGILGRKLDLPGKVILGAFAACFIAGLALGGYVVDEGRPMERTVRFLGASATYFEREPGPVWSAQLAVQIPGMCYLYFLAIRDFARRRDLALLPLLVGFLAFFASIFVDILTATGSLRIMYTAEYSFLVLIFIMDQLLLERFVAARREAETLSRSLGDMVSERTEEIRKLADELIKANEELKEKNASLTELAERDGMTELLNHAAFHRRFSELFNLSRRHAIPITVMIIDIDHFKSINDRFGHQAGDAVIRRFAETLRAGSRSYDIKGRYSGGITPSALRNYDIAGRYGGDEFAIALPYCGVGESKIVAERICSMIRALRFEGYPELRVGASIGCAVLADASRASDELRAIRLADRALYAAKEGGRDGYVIRTPDDDIEILE
jgi:GGDEF domain-containing protein